MCVGDEFFDMAEFQMWLDDRVRYNVQRWSSSYGGSEEQKVPNEDGELISSRLRHGKDMHAPVIDLDLPVRLVPSQTKGHAHLYINVPVKWRDYKRLLKALEDAGLCEPGWVASAIRQGESAVTAPGYIREKKGYGP